MSNPQKSILDFSKPQIPTLKELKKDNHYLSEREIIALALEGKVTLTRAEIDELHVKSAGCGQFFTPQPIAELVAYLADIKAGETVIDPACGLGNLLEPCKAYTDPKNIFGLEVMYDTAQLAKLLSLNVVCTNTLENIPNDQYDVVVANPPFGVAESGLSTWENYELNKNGAKTRGTNNLEILFLELCIRIAKRRVVIIVPNSILSGGKWEFARKWVLDHYRLCAVISLPEKTFWKSARNNNKYTTPTTGVHTSILVIDKARPSDNYNVWMCTPEALEDIRSVKEEWTKFIAKELKP